MAKLKYIKILKASENLVVGDEMRVGGLCVRIEDVSVNDYDDLILVTTIVGSTVKKRSKLTIIMPKKMPVTILE